MDEKIDKGDNILLMANPKSERNFMNQIEEKLKDLEDSIKLNIEVVNNAENLLPIDLKYIRIEEFAYLMKELKDIGIIHENTTFVALSNHFIVEDEKVKEASCKTIRSNLNKEVDLESKFPEISKIISLFKDLKRRNFNLHKSKKW